MKIFPSYSPNWAITLLAAALLSGCATPRSAPRAVQPAPLPPPPSPLELAATLTDPINIDLRWKHGPANVAGYFVEYSPNANGEFLVIDALAPQVTAYRHPHLLPHTRFVFRVRPYFGKTSNVVEIATGKEGPQQETSTAGSQADPPASAAAKHALKSAATADQAAPSDLKATLIPPAGVKLEWQNHASDADGYLLEIKPVWETDFKISAFLPPDATSIVSYGFPFDTKFAIRVRAFYYGPSSNLAEQTTGAEPTPDANTKP